MRPDQLGEMIREASPNPAGSDADLPHLALRRRDCAREIANAYRSGRSSSSSEDSQLISKIVAVLEGLSRPPSSKPVMPPETAPVSPQPAVLRRETIGLGYLVCLEDGCACQDLGQHLQAKHGLSPAQYRLRWGLPLGYPMKSPTSRQERVAWQRRLALLEEGADRGPETWPMGIWPSDDRAGLETSRPRRRHRRGAPAALRHDRVQARSTADRRSEPPRNDGFWR